ncbi:diguanylate cyclase [Mycoplasma sp. CAG:956]|nr:diguanylate cyclase [Mycoplasma sp. CAG:956]
MILMPIYYLEINIICIIILLAIFDKFKDESLNNYSDKYYEKTLLATISFSLFALISGIFNGTSYNFSQIILIISHTLYFFSESLIGYFYTNYILKRINLQEKREYKFILYIPLILSIFFLIINLTKKILFTISIDNLYSPGKYLYLYNLINAVYVLIIITYLISYYFYNKNSKNEIKSLILFTLLPIVSAGIQNYNYGIILGQVGFTLSELLIYFNNQKKEANYDELTGVYNRRAFNKRVNKIIYSNKSMFLMLMDADDFKIINDKYGHLEGDKALIQIAYILNRAINNTHKNYSLARYGGDEFVIVGNIQNKDEVAQLINQIEEEEKKYNKETNNKYNIKLSIGYALQNDNHTSVEDLIKEADALMYAKKRKRKNNC